MKRIVSLLLCAALIFSFVIPVYAETGSTEAATEATETLQESQPATEAAETVAEESDAASEATEAPSAPAEDSADPEEETTAPAEETTAPAEAPTESTDAAEETTEATEEATLPTEEIVTDCICGAADDNHTADCPLYIPESEIIIPAKNFANVAPFLDPVEGPALARFFSLFSARAVEEPSEDKEGIVTAKTAEDNGNGSYTITVESYVTGSRITTTEQVDVPTDIVLVLDQSGSMSNSFGYNYSSSANSTNSNLYSNRNNLVYLLADGTYATVTVNRSWSYNSGYSYTYSYRINGATTTIGTSEGANYVPAFENLYIRSNASALDALKTAVTTFVNNVNTKAKGTDGTYGTEDDVNHRIAVVGFGRANYGTDPYLNTELFIGATQYEYRTSAAAQYGNAFQDMNTEAGYNNVIASKNALDANGGTYIDLGIEMANGIFNANPVEAGVKRNRVVVIFTDGAPGYNGSYNGNAYGTSGDAAAVESVAYTNISTTKNTHGATVYTVGIFSGADASSAGSNANNASASQRANYFMQHLSSNTAYPQSPSYYLSAADAGTLNNIFQQISNNISSGGASVTLDSTTVLKDIVSPYFEIPAGAEVSAHTESYIGTADGVMQWQNNNDSLEPTVEGSTVTVTGFDYSENYVGTDTTNGQETARGKKLVLEITVEPKDGFLGGNGVPTNDSASGLYDAEDTLLENLPRPTVDVDIPAVDVTVADKNVYLLGDLSEADLLSGSSVNNNLADIYARAYDDDAENDPWEDDFVNVTRALTETSYSDLTEDTSYTLSYRIETTDGQNSSEDSATGNINVYKPVVTWRDSEIEINQTADYNDNYVSVEWKHGETVADAAMGAAPELSYTYEPGEAAFLQDTNVNVTVKIGDTDVITHVTFEHENCGFDGCDWEAAKAEGAEFIVHIKSFDLTITKFGCEDIDVNQTFLFNITGPNGFVMQVVIQGNGSATIKNLPVGEYTITEDQNWSWRYKAEVGVQTIDASDVVNGVATVSFVNKRTEDKWLSGSAVVENIFEALTSLVGE